MKFLFVALLIFISFPALAQKKMASVYKVGMTTRLFSDESRTNWAGDAPRPLLTTIWYPTGDDAIEKKSSSARPINRFSFRDARQKTRYRRFAATRRRLTAPPFIKK